MHVVLLLLLLQGSAESFSLSFRLGRREGKKIPEGGRKRAVCVQLPAIENYQSQSIVCVCVCVYI